MIHKIILGIWSITLIMLFCLGFYILTTQHAETKYKTYIINGHKLQYKSTQGFCNVYRYPENIKIAIYSPKKEVQLVYPNGMCILATIDFSDKLTVYRFKNLDGSGSIEFKMSRNVLIYTIIDKDNKQISQVIYNAG